MAKRTFISLPVMLMVSFCLAGLDAILIPRVSYVDGEVSVQESGEENWIPVDLNLPLQPQDRLRVERESRLEIEVIDGSVIRLNEWSMLTLSSLAEKAVELDLQSGQMILRTEGGADYQVSTPAGRFHLDDNGLYRINALPNHPVEVMVHYGKAEWRHQTRKERIERSQKMVISSEYHAQRTGMSDEDPFDVWSRKRDERYVTSKAHRYLPDRNRYAGVVDLDLHGNWHYLSSYGYCWAPTGITAGWAPYRYGYWRYTNRWGWTWVSYDPWGWLPYHYGRWFRHPFYGWLWYPDAYWGSYFWSPALVRFYMNGGYIGWIPLGPGDVYYPQKPDRQEAGRIIADNIRRSLIPGSSSLPRPDDGYPREDNMVPVGVRQGGGGDHDSMNSRSSVGLTYQALTDFRAGRGIRAGQDDGEDSRRTRSARAYQPDETVIRALFPEIGDDPRSVRDDGRAGGAYRNRDDGNRARQTGSGATATGDERTDVLSERESPTPPGITRNRQAAGERESILPDGETRRESTQIRRGTALAGDSTTLTSRDRYRTRSLNVSRTGSGTEVSAYADRVFQRTAVIRRTTGWAGSSGGYSGGYGGGSGYSGGSIIRTPNTGQRSSSSAGRSAGSSSRSTSSSTRTNERK
ncbi:MAG: FecR domain-containing protein [Acidobacteria bacterium]|nr:FecR domain-containing protein [Acidobacteriota bacterium]